MRSGWTELHRFRSQIRRRPVEREQLVDLFDRLAERDDRAARGRRCASSVGSPPSSASIRRTMPSISPAKPKITPDWIAPRVDLPIAAYGLAELDPRDPRAALGERRERDLDPGRDRAAEVLAVGRDDVEVDAGAEVDHDARSADPVVGGDRVHQPVGPDLVRVVDPDRHPRLHPGADQQAWGVEVATSPCPRTDRPSGGTTEDTDERLDLVEPRSRSAPAGRRSARRSRRRWRRRPCESASARSALARGRRPGGSGCCRCRIASSTGVRICSCAWTPSST